MRYLWTELKKWFALPQIVIIITMFLVFYLAFKTSFGLYLSITLYILIVIWCAYKNWQLNKVFKLRKEKSNKKWMLEEMIFKQAGGTNLIVILQFYNLFNITDDFFINTYAVVSLAGIFTLLILINYISLELLPGKAEKLINETYPEFSL